MDFPADKTESQASKDSNRQIKIGAALSYLSIALNVASGLLVTPWIILQIGQEQFGLYTLVNSLIGLFLVDFGLGSATARYLSRYVASSEESKVKDFLGLVYKLYIVVDVVIAFAFVAVYVCMDHIYAGLSSEEIEQLRSAFLIAATFSILNFPFVTLNGILTAYERFVHLKLADILYRVCFVVATVVALKQGNGLIALVAVNAAAGAVSTMYKLASLKRSTHVTVNWWFWDRSLRNEVFGFSAWSTLAALSQRLIFNITPTVLGVVSNTVAVAVFGIVVTIEGYAYLLSNAINSLFLPRVSQLYSEDNPGEKVMPLMLKVGRFQFALNGLVLTGFILVGRDFLDLWLGPGFEDAYFGIIVVLLPGLFLNSLQIANTVMVVEKKVSSYARILLITGLINVALSFPMSYELGLMGACISIGVAYSVRAILLNSFYQTHLGINMKYFAKECYLRMSAPVVATLLLCPMFLPGIGVSGWLGFGLDCAVVVLVYGIVLLCCVKELRDMFLRKVDSGGR